MRSTFWTRPGCPEKVSPGPPYNTSTTLSDVSSLPEIIAPPNQLRLGGMLICSAFGTFSTAASAPTLKMGIYLGGVAGVALIASSAVTMTASAANWQWSLFYEGRVRTDGLTGTIMGRGYWDYNITNLTTNTHRLLPETALALVTINTNVSKLISVGAQWGTSSASNTLQCHNLMVQILG